MDVAKWIWDTLEKLKLCEKDGLDDAFLADYCQALLWPKMTWCREVCVAIGECRSKGLLADVEHEVLAYTFGMGTTKPNDNVFNRLRKVEKLSPSGRMGHHSVRHNSLMSPILPESDMKQLVPTHEDIMAAMKTSAGFLKVGLNDDTNRTEVCTPHHRSLVQTCRRS